MSLKIEAKSALVLSRNTLSQTTGSAALSLFLLAFALMFCLETSCDLCCWGKEDHRDRNYTWLYPAKHPCTDETLPTDNLFSIFFLDDIICIHVAKLLCQIFLVSFGEIYSHAISFLYNAIFESHKIRSEKYWT